MFEVMQSKRRGRAGKMLLVRFCEFGPLAYPRLDRSAQYPKFWPSGEPGTVLLKYCRYLFSKNRKSDRRYHSILPLVRVFPRHFRRVEFCQNDCCRQIFDHFEI